MTGRQAAVDLAAIHELLDLTLEGARGNQRPDLVGRLSAAAAKLSTPPVSSAVVASAAGLVVEALESLEIDLRARRAELADPGRASRLLAEQRHADGVLRRFERLSADWPRMLADAVSAGVADLEFDVRERTRTVLQDGVAAVESGQADAERLREWLTRRLFDEADSVNDRLRQLTVSACTEVTVHLDLSIAGNDIAAGPSLPQEPIVSAILSRLPERVCAPAPWSSRLLGVVMPTYGGTMMTLVLPRFLNLHLPGLVTALCAVAGALTMGGAALAAERQRQRGRRNGETVTALRDAVDGFQLALVKHLREASRRLRERLDALVQDAVTRRRLELAAAEAAARKAAARAQASEDGLRDIGEDLLVLAELRARALRLVRLQRCTEQAEGPGQGLPGELAQPDATIRSIASARTAASARTSRVSAG